MIVTLEDFKAEVERYLDMVGEEEIVITKAGKGIARILPGHKGKAALIRSLAGTLPITATIEEAKAERLAKLEA